MTALNRAILITGASKGIGLATAQLLSSQGWAVIGIARHSVDDFPGEFLVADLADADVTQRLADSVAARGNVLGIVNNVGIAKSETMGSVETQDFAAIMEFNVRPALQLTQALLPGMRAVRFGRIVNITSLVTLGLPFRTSYAAAKSALESVTRTMAIELAADGITANAVAPGPTETELFRTNNALGSAGEARYLAQIPVGRLGRPEDIAAAIGFLASDAAAFITGQTIHVDGGASLGRNA
jgi:NAD(P)-dependent dehydrogenase (short-subunit alcohol dehydrogenase family)